LEQGDTVGPDNIRGTIAWDVDISPTAWTIAPSVCMGVRKGDTYDWDKAKKLIHPRGANYLDAMCPYVTFNTIMPPNSPSCAKYNEEPYRIGLSTATSFHTGGVNCGLLDGSVRFIQDSVDTNGLPNLRAGTYLQGESPLGVWGALGTPDGGESAAL
jgi:prepilin-type processing-associated H-X9-DG protein